MKSKYRRYFKTSRHKKYNIEIRVNNTGYIFMYCRKTVKDFDKKAKRIYARTFSSLIKPVYNAIFKKEHYE